MRIGTPLVCALALAASLPACKRSRAAGVPTLLTADAARAAAYRFPLTQPDADADADATIATLEARFRAAPSPFDANELAEIYYRRGQLAGDRRDYERSAGYAHDSLAILDKPNGARLTLAKLANAKHDFRGAIAFAEAALQTKASPSAHDAIATAQLALGDLVRAAEAADRAIALRATDSTLLVRALVNQARGRDAEAAADFARAATLEQSGDKLGAARLRALWGRFLLRRGDYGGAKRVLDEASRIAPDLPLVIAQRGELALRTGKLALAATEFEHAFELSRQVRYLIDETRARELAGQHDRATALRDQTEVLVRQDLTTDELGHRVDLVEILVDSGRPEALAEAVRFGKDELARRGSWEVRFQYARALYRAGELDAARTQIRAALDAGTREAQVYELASRLEPDAKLAREYRALADAIDPAHTGWRKAGL